MKHVECVTDYSQQPVALNIMLSSVLLSVVCVCLGEGRGGGVSTVKALACHCRNELNPNTYLHVFFVKVFVFVLDFSLLNIQLLPLILEGFLPV